MIHTGQIADVVTIQNHFADQFVHILPDLIVFDHNDHQIHVVKECIQIVIL